ncbi:DedA family protein [Haloechinothrix sp. LS1_15]|uniref:DedA family protein n=1 Tax=Haloechinothrix sp. LS1_15 TaxID=2652248 RepID=UPI002947BC85|nr:DedA family protein [Haloechinothrix sp. LS1_15]MDV6011163.1 DedA family protein [Haloechinothrix sp. LS1_15]
MTLATVEYSDMGFDLLAGVGTVMLWLIVLSFIYVQCGLVIGLVLPGGTLLFPAGVVLAQQGADVQVWLLAAATTVAAFAGNLTGYVIGHKAGAMVSARRGGTVVRRDRLERTRAFLDRNGIVAVIVARWVPWAGPLIPPIAGAAGMDRRRFALGSALAALLWVPVVLLAGYYAAGLLRLVPGWLEATAVWVMIALVAVGTVAGVWRYLVEMRRPAEPLDVADSEGVRGNVTPTGATGQHSPDGA